MDSRKLKELQKLMLEGNSDEVPSGWVTRQEFAKASGKSIDAGDKIISKLLNAGLATRKMFRRPTKAGVRPVPHFSFHSVKASRR